MDVQVKTRVLEVDIEHLKKTIKNLEQLIESIKRSFTTKEDELEGNQFEIANSIAESAIFEILNSTEHMEKLISDLENLQECVQGYEECQYEG